MKNYKGCIDSIESMSTIDGPGLRSVVFFSGCKKRCLYCHNPEMWIKGKNNYSVDDLYNKIKKYFDYYNDSGGVTFSGGEPLIQYDFLLEICKKLKKDNINVAIDTAGSNLPNEEIFKYIDIVILDIKHVEDNPYYDLVKYDINEVNKFIDILNKHNVRVMLRQVIVPGIHDNKEYLIKLNNYVKNIKNVEKISFIPYHKLGEEKYIKLNIKNYLINTPIMDINECNELYKEFIKMYEGDNNG